MKSEKKNHKAEQAKLAKLQSRRGEMWTSQETAKGELGEAKTLFGKQLLDGADVEKLFATLAQKDAALTIISAGLAELDSQIASQQEVVAEAEVALAAAETSATMKRMLRDAVTLIKLLGNAQVDIHRNINRTQRLQLLRTEHGVRGG